MGVDESVATNPAWRDAKGENMPSEVIPGVAYQGNIGILRAPYRCGSSWFALDLAIGIVYQHEWLSRKLGVANRGATYVHTMNPGLVRAREDQLLNLRGLKTETMTQSLVMLEAKESDWQSLLDCDNFPLTDLIIVDCPTLPMVKRDRSGCYRSMFQYAAEHKAGWEAAVWLFVVRPEWSVERFSVEHHPLDLDFEIDLRPTSRDQSELSLEIYTRYFPPAEPIPLRFNAPTFELASEAGQEEPLGVAEFVEQFYGTELEPERVVVERAMEAKVSNRKALKLVKQARDKQLVRSERPNPREPYMVAKLAAVTAGDSDFRHIDLVCEMLEGGPMFRREVSAKLQEGGASDWAARKAIERALGAGKIAVEKLGGNRGDRLGLPA